MALTGSEPELRLGDSGEGVVLLQVRLYGLGIFGEFPDGTFALSTENAVRQLQAQVGLENDGEVTADTWQALQHQESQYGIQYQFASPYDAVAQLRYDLQNPGSASGDFGVLTGAPGQYTPSSQGGLYDRVNAQVQYSEDAQWRWTGYEWEPADTGYDEAAAEAAYGSATVSADGQWWWDGYDWQPVAGAPSAASAAQWAGTVSEDGQWRWDGAQWQPS